MEELGNISTKKLVDELRFRDSFSKNILFKDILNEMEDGKLINEIIEYLIDEDMVVEKEDVLPDICSMNSYDLKRKLCDVVEVGYHIKTDNLLSKLKYLI